MMYDNMRWDCLRGICAAFVWVGCMIALPYKSSVKMLLWWFVIIGGFSWCVGMATDIRRSISMGLSYLPVTYLFLGGFLFYEFYHVAHVDYQDPDYYLLSYACISLANALGFIFGLLIRAIALDRRPLRTLTAVALGKNPT